MANVILPTIIQGPCYLSHGGVVLYVKKDIHVADTVESWNVETATGIQSQRHKSRSYKITATPVGMLTPGILDYFYAAHKDLTKIGTSIINGALVIYSVTETKTYSFNKAGLSKPPKLTAGPGGTVFDQAEWTAIGDVTKQPTDAAFLRTITGSLTPDTSFDETKIVTDIYTAAFSSSPYNSIGSMNGFKLTFGHTVKAIPAGDVGIADIILADVSAGASFIPSNLTEAQMDTLLAIQNTGALLPGQSYASAGTDLVITGTQVGWVFTLKKAGPKKQDRQYVLGEHRHKEIEFVNQRVFASGAAAAYFAYTAPS